MSQGVYFEETCSRLIQELLLTEKRPPSKNLGERQCTFTYYEKVKNETTGRWDVNKHELSGTFIQWGYDIHESDTGLASFSVGIIELSSGKILLIPAEYICFTKEKE